MWDLRGKQKDIEAVIEFLKDGNRFYHAAQIAMMFDRYVALMEKENAALLQSRGI